VAEFRLARTRHDEVIKISAKDLFKLTISIIVCQLAGFIGSLFTRPAIPGWYATLNKPSFTPPSVVFGPVWIVLYLSMGISMFLVWRRSAQGQGIKTTMVLFAIQLILNTLWSVLFFGLRSPLAGFVDILLLWATILLTLILFYKISRTAGILLVPYILWVSFAALLNASLWMLNR
jgi:benzodiazapine receptor